MKIIIFGATGSIGRHLVTQALDNQHQVIAFARNPHNLNIDHPNLIYFAGDVFQFNCVAEAIKGCDAVLITLGSKKLSGDVRSTGTYNIVKAMTQLNIKRLICQTTLGMGDSYNNLNLYWKTIMFGLILRNVFKDHAIQETIVKNSSLDWTLVRPAAFTDNQATEKYRFDFPDDDKSLSLSISRKNVAHFMLQQLSSNTFIKQAPGLSN